MENNKSDRHSRGFIINRRRNRYLSLFISSQEGKRKNRKERIWLVLLVRWRRISRGPAIWLPSKSRRISMPYPSRARGTRKRVVLTIGRLQDDARIATRMAQRMATDGGIIEFECPSGRSLQTQTATECQRDRTYCGTSVYLTEVASVERHLRQEFSYSFLPKINYIPGWFSEVTKISQKSILNICVSMKMFIVLMTVYYVYRVLRDFVFLVKANM